MECPAKRKNEDNDDILAVVKKIKAEVVDTSLQNGEMKGSICIKLEVNNDVEESGKIEDDEEDPFHGTENVETSLNNSNEVSEDESDAEDGDGIDSEDSDDTGEEDKTLDDEDGEIDEDDDELGGEENESGEYLLSEDGEDMIGVEAVLGEEDEDMQENGEVMNGIENLMTPYPHDLDAKNDLQCKKCYKIFARKSYLRGHSCSKDLEINNKALKCKFCNKRYSHKINLKLHLKLHNNPKQFQCHICLKYLSSSSSLKVHVKTHTSEKAFKCDHCPLAFNQKVHLNDHILSHHTNMRPFSCHLCNKTYVSKSVLKKHLKKHLGLYKHSCEVCGKLFFERSALKKHMRTHTTNFPLNKLKSEEPLQCYSCLTYFHFKYKLITHQMLEHGLCQENEKCYQCPLCDIKFNISSEPQTVEIKQEKRTEDDGQSQLDNSAENKQNAHNTNNLLEPEYPTHLNDHKSIFAKLKITPNNLNMILSEHIKSHEYVENHMCELCYKVFESRENLMRHLKIHDDKERKRFKCEQCDKRFMTNVDLGKHSNAVHERLRLHECDICGRNFSQRNNLKRHLEEVHRTDGMKFECYVCSKVLATGHSLKRHILIHNGPKYTCDICQREFTRVYELNVHKKLHEDESLVNQLKCEFCGKLFLKRSNLKAHIDNNHLDYTCLECRAVGENIKFETKKNLLLHLKTQHKNVISNVYLTCLICFKTFLNETDLGRHMKMHTDDNQIQCQFCQRYFSRHYNLKQHLKTCTKNISNGILTCSDNEEHTQSSHDEEDVSDMLVPEIKMEYEVNDNYELEEAEEGEENIEPMQHFENVDIKPIIIKMEKHDSLSVEDIINAGEVSITPIPLSRPSINSQTQPSSSNQPSGNKIIQCHICMKTFAKRDSLKKHMKVFHTYIPPELINQEPGEGTPNMLEAILQDPLAVTSSAVIQCKICKKTFTRKDSLRKHMRRFHIISDPTVKKEFTEGEINRNMLDVILKESGHEIKSRIPCNLCYKTFTRKDSLRKHMKIFHTRRSILGSSEPLKSQPEQNEQDPLSIVKIENENGGQTESVAAAAVENIVPNISNIPNDRIPCALCDKTFTRKDSLKKHTRIFHTQNQVYSYGSQGLGDKDKSNLLSNVPFIDHIRCELCDKSFTRKDSLKKHNRIFHGGADPQVIDEHMATGSADFLEVVIDENGQGPVSTANEILCRICNRTFTRNYNLKKHMKTVHKMDNNQPYFMFLPDMDPEEVEDVEQFGSLSNSMLEVIMDGDDEENMDGDDEGNIEGDDENMEGDDEENLERDDENIEVDDENMEGDEENIERDDEIMDGNDEENLERDDENIEADDENENQD